WVFHLAFRDDGKLLLTAGGDGLVRFWNAENPEKIEEVDEPLWHYSAVFTAAFSHDGKTVLTGDVDQNAQLWDAETRNSRLHLVGHSGCINDAIFSPDDRLVVTGSQDRTARLWDKATGKPIGPTMMHPGEVIRVMFSRDGKNILTVADDQTSRSWPIPLPMNGSAEEIELWAQVTTGMELDPEGGVSILDPSQWQDRRVKLLEISQDGLASHPKLADGLQAVLNRK